MKLIFDNDEGKCQEVKFIKDIRLFELDVSNIDYQATPYYIAKSQPLF